MNALNALKSRRFFVHFQRLQGCHHKGGLWTERLPRRKNRRIASYVTIFTTQTLFMDEQGSREAGRRKRQINKKTSELGIFFAGNRLSVGHGQKPCAFSVF